MSVSDNRKKWDKLRSDLNKINGSYTKVGFLENGQLGQVDKPDKDSETVDDMQKMIKIATANNYGVRNKGGQGWRIPPTFFMELGIDENKASISNAQEKLIGQILLTNIEVKKGLALLGEFATNKIKNKIVEIRHPRNRPQTIRYKGFDNRLIHTGQMKNTVNHKEKLA